MELSAEDRDAMVMQYQRLVHKVTNSLFRQYRHVAREDFESYAQIGLLELIDRYDPNRNCTFLTYACRSLWWLTKKALGESDWHTRHIRERYGDSLPVIERWPTNNMDETFSYQSNAPRRNMELIEFVNSAISGYSERRQAIFRAYYGADNTMSAVGKQFGISKQGVQQCIKPMMAHCRELAKELDLSPVEAKQVPQKYCFSHYRGGLHTGKVMYDSARGYPSRRARYG